MVRYTTRTMSFTPRQVKEQYDAQAHNLDRYQRKALLGMLGMVLLTFLASNMWALLWQGSDWLVATILPATVIDLTNSERERSAASTLRRNEQLDAAAQQKAEHMAAEGYFAHYSPDGVTPWHWFAESGYEYVHAGENLAVHFTDSRSMVQAWMDSPTHRDNIVNEQFTEIGVGTARGRYQGYETTFVVQLFGTPAAPRPESVELSTADTEAVATSAPTTTVAEAAETPSEESASVAGSGEEQSLTVAGETAPDAEEVASEPEGASEADEQEVAPTESAPANEPDSPTTVATAAAEDAESTAEADTALAADDVATTTTPFADIATETDVTVWHSTAGATRPSMVWQTGMHTTSTDRQVATSAVPATTGTRYAGFLGYATQPQTVMQFLYLILSVGVLGMIVWAIRLEARRHQFVQMGYSFAMILLMVGLWYLHVTVTSGALIA